MHLGLPKKLHYAKQMQTQEFVSRLVLVMVCLFDFGDFNLDKGCLNYSNLAAQLQAGKGYIDLSML